MAFSMALIGSVRVGSVHKELRPDSNSTWTDWSASHLLGLFLVDMAKNVQQWVRGSEFMQPRADIFVHLNPKWTEEANPIRTEICLSDSTRNESPSFSYFDPRVNTSAWRGWSALRTPPTRPWTWGRVTEHTLKTRTTAPSHGEKSWTQIIQSATPSYRDGQKGGGH